MNLKQMTYAQLKEQRTEKSRLLNWAKEHQQWAVADGALSDLDSLNLEIGERPEYNGTTPNRYAPFLDEALVTLGEMFEVADTEGMDDETVIPVWPADVAKDFEPLKVKHIRAIMRHFNAPSASSTVAPTREAVEKSLRGIFGAWHSCALGTRRNPISAEDRDRGLKEGDLCDDCVGQINAHLVDLFGDAALPNAVEDTKGSEWPGGQGAGNTAHAGSSPAGVHQSALSHEAPTAYLWQHDETGQTLIREAAFPDLLRGWSKVRPLYDHPAAPSSIADRKPTQEEVDAVMERWEDWCKEVGLPANWRDRLTITLRSARKEP
jgi:hypothetical protein